jgi:hypothetical protein
MATTSPDNIWTPDSGDDYALTTDLAAMADTIQAALSGGNWVNLSVFGGNAAPGVPIPRIRRVGTRILLEGSINCTAAGGVFNDWGATTIPNGYRPVNSQTFVVAGSSGAAPMRAFVSSATGNLTVRAPVVGTSTYISLDTITWDIKP